MFILVWSWALGTRRFCSPGCHTGSVTTSIGLNGVSFQFVFCKNMFLPHPEFQDQTPSNRPVQSRLSTFSRSQPLSAFHQDRTELLASIRCMSCSTSRVVLTAGPPLLCSLYPYQISIVAHWLKKMPSSTESLKLRLPAAVRAITKHAKRTLCNTQ
jgi:hypothetical protein